MVRELQNPRESALSCNGLNAAMRKKLLHPQVDRTMVRSEGAALLTKLKEAAHVAI